MDDAVKKKPKKDSFSVASLKAKDSATKRMMFLGAAMLVVILMFGYSKYISMKRVSVVKLASTVIAGDVVDFDDADGTSANIKKHDMLYSAYLEEGLMDIPQADGTVKKEQGYVLWKDREDYKDWYFNSYQAKDTVFTKVSASKEMQYKNPLVENMPDGNEEYVLPVDSAGINMHQLFPGTTLRMRVSLEVPLSLQDECRRAVASKTVYDGTSVVLDILTKYGYSTSSSGADSLAEGATPDEGFDASAVNPNDERKVFVSEVIFDRIEAVDMLSTSGESIFEVYMSLLKMPLDQRTPYLQTSFKEDKSGEFRARITPMSFVLNLTKGEASKLHEFESMNYETKWTIIKTATSSDMLKDFITINEQINTASK